MRCQLCDLHKVSIQEVKGLGPVPCKLMVVGRNPGRDEDKAGLPFVGGAGRVLTALLSEAGIKRSTVYVTNAVRCYTEGNEEPSLAEITACKPKLYREIEEVRPSAIIALGKVALYALTGRDDISNQRGSVLEYEASYGRVRVVPTFHPAYLMRGQQQYWSTVVRDLRTAKEQSEGAKKEEVVYEIYDGSQSDDWIDLWLCNSENPISFDIETPGELKPWNGPVIGMSFGYAPGRSIHFRVRSGGERKEQEWSVCKDILEGPAPKIVQRGTFDCFYLKYHGIEVQNLVFDTKIAQHLISPTLPTSLAFLASVHTDIAFYKPHKSEGVVRMTPSELALYNNKDADATRRIYFALKKELSEDPRLDSLMARQVRLIRTISRMQLRGVKVDLDAVTNEIEQIRAVNDSTEELFFKRGINIRSSEQVGELLSSLGIPLKRTSSGKQYKVDKDTLQNTDHPVAKRILQFRELDKLRSTFLEGIQTHLVNGRVHSTYNATGTVTGRLSSVDPNLQNIPRRTRHIFIPDGDLFIDADYRQFELRIIAAISGEETLEQDLNDGVNIHMNIAKEVYKKDDINDKELLRAKAVVFGTVYGRSPKSIAQEYSTTISEAERFQHAVVGKYPKLAKYKDGMSGRDEVRSAYGRVKLFDGKITEMYNFPVQSAAADTLLGSMVLLDEILPIGAYVALSVYDNILVDCTNELRDVVIEQIKEVMERPITELGGRRFPCKISVGPNWKEVQAL